MVGKHHLKKHVAEPVWGGVLEAVLELDPDGDPLVLDDEGNDRDDTLDGTAREGASHNIKHPADRRAVVWAGTVAVVVQCLLEGTVHGL